jgi:hypothetical protein
MEVLEPPTLNQSRANQRGQWQLQRPLVRALQRQCTCGMIIKIVGRIFSLLRNGSIISKENQYNTVTVLEESAISTVSPKLLSVDKCRKEKSYVVRSATAQRLTKKQTEVRPYVHYRRNKYSYRSLIRVCRFKYRPSDRGL